MRKILSILLALSLALSLSVPALAASGDVTYLAYNTATGEFDTETKAEGEYTEVTGQTAWEAGWYVVSEDVTISTRITVTGDVHLILADGKTLKAEKGITVNSGNSLTIYGQENGTGTLTTGTPDWYYAGIGGGDSQSSGPITIHGGTVTATGGSYAAGIGGSNGGTGTVTIHGGTVTAKGGNYGAGIGGGENGSVTVTINGGTVTATGGWGGAGIGTGSVFDDSVTVTITISGGTVTAKSGTMGAGIGTGYFSNIASVTNTVTISGGTVTATGGAKAGVFGAGAAIGSGGSGRGAGTEIAESSFSNAVVLKKSGASGSTMTGAIYGSPTLTADATVPDGATLTIPADSTLTIDEGVTLTNNGTIINNGRIIIKGILIDQGNIIIDENSKNQGGAASLAHEVAPAYTVTIPASVTIGNKATVKAENVRVDYGKQVVVRLSSDSALTVALEGDTTETLAYTVSAGGQEIAQGGAVLAVNPDDATETALAGGSAELAFSLAESAVVKYSGSYTGTVTFTVSVEQADSTGGTD